MKIIETKNGLMSALVNEFSPESLDQLKVAFLENDQRILNEKEKRYKVERELVKLIRVFQDACEHVEILDGFIKIKTENITRKTIADSFLEQPDVKRFIDYYKPGYQEIQE